MCRLIKILTFLYCVFLCSETGKAHSLDQISYVFDQDEKGTFLTIHLTPKGAIDLITTLKPELKDQSIIKLKKYYDDFTTYFNTTIDLKIDGRPIIFTFNKGDLLSHDAILQYRLEKTENYQGIVEIEIRSFVEVYQRIKNYVTVISPNDKEKCILTKKTTNCTFTITAEDTQLKSSMGSWYVWLMVVFLFITSAFFISRKIKSS